MIKSLYFRKFTEETYPFNVNAIRNTEFLDLSNQVTVFVGDNGSGKSTLLKAIAYYNNSINVSKNDISSSYYEEEIKLAEKMSIHYKVKTRAGFFFSGEEFITYINNMKSMKEQ